MTSEMVSEMLEQYEGAKMLFRWEAEDGKLWGFWVGIDKPGRLPGESRRGHNEKVGPEPPQEALASFLGNKAFPNGNKDFPNGNEKFLGFGFGLGSGLGSGVGSGSGLGEGFGSGAGSEESVSVLAANQNQKQNQNQEQNPVTNSSEQEPISQSEAAELLTLWKERSGQEDTENENADLKKLLNLARRVGFSAVEQVLLWLPESNYWNKPGPGELDGVPGFCNAFKSIRKSCDNFRAKAAVSDSREAEEEPDTFYVTEQDD
jgi:hypothetical protein